MPPKSAKQEGGGGGKDDGDIQTLLLEKDLEIETLTDKISRLEKRSQLLEDVLEKQYNSTKEMEEKLHDVISSLSSQLKAKETKVYQLEETFQELKAENMRAIDNFTREMRELQNTHKFVTEDLRLQLANAEVQLRDIDEFREQKASTEQEIASLKEQLQREKKEHQEAISDTERVALQDKQRLRKEMVARIEETKMQMLQHMDEQLTDKTKKTILENDQLGKELAYHVRQTHLLLHKNEKLVQENVELHRQVLVAKEVEAELAKRNLMNQRTIRILLYKFQELHSDKSDDEELKIFGQGDDIKNKELEQIKSFIEEQIQAVESASGAEEAMKFLYACLDDIELEDVSNIANKHDAFECSVPEPRPDTGEPLGILRSLSQCTNNQRQELLMYLLRSAISLRAVAQSRAFGKPTNDFFSMISYGPAEAKGAVPVDDILSLSVEASYLDEPHCRCGSRSKIMSVGVQTDTMNLEERLVLDIKERLRPWSSQGAFATMELFGGHNVTKTRCAL